MTNTPKYIIIHCTDYSYQLLRDQFLACNGWHKDRGFPISSLGWYVGYHRLITGDKNYIARQDGEEGAHCNQRLNGISINFQSLGVCIGFDGDIELPLPEHYALLQKQVWDWQDIYGITNDKVFFHRHFATDKTCPGSLLSDAWLTKLLQRPMAAPAMPVGACAAQEKELGYLRQLLADLQVWLKSKGF